MTQLSPIQASPIKAWLLPHRMVLLAFGLLLALASIYFLRWDWLPDYGDLILKGIWTTMWMLVVSCIIGFILATALGFAQAAGPIYLAQPALWFCTIIRGTPLLLQIWLLYYGLGSLFPQFPWIREAEFWPILRQAWPYALLSLSLSYAAYEGEIIRAAFLSVPKGQLEAARAFGMPRHKIFTRIWFPQAIRSVLPTLGGETILQLKATPLVATISVVEIYAVSSRVRSDTFITYEPLMLLAVIYIIIAAMIGIMFKYWERRIPN